MRPQTLTAYYGGPKDAQWVRVFPCVQLGSRITEDDGYYEVEMIATVPTFVWHSFAPSGGSPR